MNPEEFIKIASRFAATGPAGARSAVSRAYYGAFHLAIQSLEKVGCAPPKNAKAHVLVKWHLQCADEPNATEAAELIGDLFEDRLRADYKLGDREVESTEYAMLSVESADRVKKLLASFEEACQDSSVLERLKAGVEELRQRG